MKKPCRIITRTKRVVLGAALFAAILQTPGGVAMADQGTGTGNAGDGVPGCLPQVSGHLDASPAFIDRTTSIDRAVTFSWSVSAPSGCASAIRVSISPLPRTPTGDAIPVSGLSGSVTAPVSKTTTFILNAFTSNAERSLATARVNVNGDPGLITASEGLFVDTNDIRTFDMQWMQPFDLDQAKSNAAGVLLWRFDAGVWGISARMVAMAQMYQVTGETRYLDHLRDLSDIALKYRDDNYPGNPDPRCHKCGARPIDEFRGKNEPGWGGVSLNSGGFNRVDEVVSSMYAYPIAAFARIVAENPALQSRYGSDALRYTNAVIQTMWAFMPQMRYTQMGGFFEGYLAHPDIYRTKPTAQQCQQAYDQEVAAQGGLSAIPADALARLNTMINCNNLREVAGHSMAYNENQAFMMMLMELWRAIGSDFYQHSNARSIDSERARLLIPLLVALQQRYFADHLETRTDASGKQYFFWHYEDDIPAGLRHPEDTSHGSVDMQYVEVLRQIFPRINVPATTLNEPIPFDQTYVQRFANTFLLRMQLGSNLAADVNGRPASPADEKDGECTGWVSLAAAESQVFSICHDITLRIVNGEQPYLRIDNHAGLLATKWLLFDLLHDHHH
jgi:hypothetical protein